MTTDNVNKLLPCADIVVIFIFFYFVLMIQSKRQRNQVKYTEDDIEARNPDNHATNQSEATDVDDGAIDENPSYADIDHTETVQVEDTERVVNSSEVSPNAYLYSGGGFCIDEGDGNRDPATDEPVERVNEAQDASLSLSTDTDEDMIKTTTTGGADQSASLDANADFPIGERVSWGLTPMPSLKRRKS